MPAVEANGRAPKKPSRIRWGVTDETNPPYPPIEPLPTMKYRWSKLSETERGLGGKKKHSSLYSMVRKKEARSFEEGLGTSTVLIVWRGKKHSRLSEVTHTDLIITLMPAGRTGADNEIGTK